MEKEKLEEVIGTSKPDGMKLLSTLSAAKNLESMQNEIEERRSSVVADKDVTDKLLENLAELTAKQIADLPDPIIEKLFTVDGKLVELEIKVPNNKKHELMRDYLVFLKESSEAEAELDKSLEGFHKELADSQTELDNMVKQYGDINGYMRSKMSESYDKAEGLNKVRIGRNIEAYDDAITLNRVKAYVRNINTDNLINDYNRLSESVYARYLRSMKKLGLSVDLTKFNNFEKNFLEEKYNKYPNIFMFTLIKMYAYKKDIKRETDGIFLSQLRINLADLYAKRINEDKKGVLLDAVREIIDTILA